MGNWQAVLLKSIDLCSMVGLIHQPWRQAVPEKILSCFSISFSGRAGSAHWFLLCYHLEGLLRCSGCSGLAPLPGGQGEITIDIRTEWDFFLDRKLLEMTCQKRQKAEKLITVHQAAHQPRIRCAFPLFHVTVLQLPCYRKVDTSHYNH